MIDRPGLKGPQARQSQIVVRQLGDETLIYDLQRDTAHCLNRTAALVWKYCSGERTVREIAQLVAEETVNPADEQLVWYALDQLGRDHLLAEAVTVPASAPGMTRGQMLKRAGIAVAAVPVVMSLSAPAASANNSCTSTTGQSCSTTGGQPCCSTASGTTCGGGGTPGICG